MIEELVRDAWRLKLDRYAERRSFGAWKRFRWLKYTIDKIWPQVLAGKARILLSVPPRCGKSETFTIYMASAYLELFPSRRVMIVGCEAELAMGFGRRCRDNLEQPDSLAPVRKDARAADNLVTEAGGGLLTAGMGGSITGRGFDLGIIDDPIKNWQDATSASLKQRDRLWFLSTFQSRAEPSASIIVTATRWAEDDLIGYLSSEHTDRWTVINLPALAEDDDPMGREPGESVCPERFSEQYFGELEAAMKSSGTGRIWASLYEGRPAPDRGNKVLREWWKTWRYDPEEEFELMALSFDLGFKKTNTSDYVVGGALGRRVVNTYVLDVERERTDFLGSLAMIRRMVVRWRPDVVYIEDSANGAAAINVLMEEIEGLLPVSPEGSKVNRLDACLPAIEAGNVFLPEGAPWVDDFIEELAVFPNGKNDDQVDMLTQGLINLRQAAGQVFIGSVGGDRRRGKKSPPAQGAVWRPGVNRVRV